MLLCELTGEWACVYKSRWVHKPLYGDRVMKKIQLDSRKLMGYKIAAPMENKIGTKAGDKVAVTSSSALSSKLGGKLGVKTS